MSNTWLPAIETPEDAAKLAKQGAIGILLFAGMNLLGLLFVYFANKSPVDASAMDAQNIQDHLLGALIVIPVLLFFAWRVYKAKGWLVAGLVLIWFIFEVALKIAGGSTNIGWIFFYVAVAAMIVNGLRGCWWLRKAVPKEN
jgi:hypothetical protein